MIDGSSQLSLAACMIESPRVWEREVINAGIDGCNREGVRRANEQERSSRSSMIVPKNGDRD